MGERVSRATLSYRRRTSAIIDDDSEDEKFRNAGVFQGSSTSNSESEDDTLSNNENDLMIENSNSDQSFVDNSERSLQSHGYQDHCSSVDQYENSLDAAVNDRTFFGINETEEDAFEEERIRNDYPHVYEDSSDGSSIGDDINETAEFSDHQNEQFEGAFRNLRLLLEKEEMNTIVDTPLLVTKSEMMLGSIKFAINHNLSQSAIEDLFTMFNSFFADSVLPRSRYHIDKLFNSNDGVEFHAVCFNCEKYIQRFYENDRQVKCHLCETVINLKDPTYTDYFVIYNIEKQVATSIEENSEYFENLKNNQNNDGIVKDFTDGKMYKKILNQLTEEEKRNFVSGIVNSDGSPVFVSSKFAVWPIQLVINEIPYDQRTNKPIVCGIWFGKGKPNMDIFLKPFVELMNRISNGGIKCTINRVQRILKVYIVCCCVDSQARAPMQGIKQYNGYYGCSWCLHPGLNVATGKGHSIKYIVLDEPVAKRTQITMLRHAQEALNSSKPVKGVKKLTMLADLPEFDIVDGFVPDSLHCNNLGIGEQFLKYWVDTRRHPYSLESEEIRKINMYLQEIKLPNQLQRLSRPIDDRKFFKGKEYENWVLFLSEPILNTFPRFQPYLQHWKLFIKGYYILMQDIISNDELHRAHELFSEFVVETERLYSRSAMTYNVHQLLHEVQSVVNWGPLATHSGYCFENGNGQIVNMIHAAKGVTRQITRAISMRQCAILLKHHVHMENPTSTVSDYITRLDKKHAKSTLKLSEARYFGKYYPTDPEWTATLSLSQRSRTYKKMVKNRCLFTSCTKARLRSDNSFALTVDGFYIKLAQFIIDSDKLKEYTLYYLVTVEQNDHPMKRIVSVSNELIAIDTNRIQKVCVHICSEALDTEYVCAVPNLFYV